MKIEDVFDLNELNVKKFTKHCLAKPEDDEKDLMVVHAYEDENGIYEPRTKGRFSKKRYDQQKDRIASMLGQLKKIHDRHRLKEWWNKEYNRLDFIDLQTKYDGTRWTRDPNCTLYLYLLANAGDFFAGFRKDKDGIFRTDLGDAINSIEPMESPSDPNLQKRFPPDKLKAAEELEKAAAEGDPDAQYRAGLGCYNGWVGFRNDYKMAAYWFGKAAEQGHAEAQNKIGDYYSGGYYGYPKDKALAAKWYEKAAVQGHADSQSSLAYMYAEGEGVPKDASKAAYWYEKWADHREARFYVANLRYLANLYYDGRYVPLNKAKAAEWYEKASAEGDRESQWKVALMYYKGDGIPSNMAKAAYWQEKLAEQGHAPSQYIIGQFYHDGTGVRRDRVKAAEWYKKAADQGEAVAQHNLAVAYFNGEGVPKDRSKAKELFRKAADQGFEESKKELRRLF